jgi:hypothetical protein
MTETVHGFPNQFLKEGGIRSISCEGKAAVVLFVNKTGRFIDEALIDIVQNYMGALPRELLADFQTDTLSASGNDGYLVLKSFHISVDLSASEGADFTAIYQ